MADTILMDAGGVLFNNVTEETDFLDRLAARHGADTHRLRREIDARDAAYETGRAHVHDVLRDALAAAGAPADVAVDAQWLDDLYGDCLAVHPEAFTAIDAIRRHRPDVLLVLTNNEAAHWDRVKDDRYGHLGRFDVIASSWQGREVKPTREFFAAVARRCSQPLDGAVLLDDNPDVLTEAGRQGLRTLHVESPSTLPEAVANLLHFTLTVADTKDRT
ncbi:HAD family hydrolase [Streptomyces sp. 769]|uniref:HAD family hydrolase n=1 Tax=Streptomyces sp. 769 TaxID=1262452 RepID=UPI000581F27F|nr:HAD family hydrolase [Streptomyces sp. 769]AJC52644.1 putative hydrolase [Streptomyces sp. 769]AJC61895.1 putative hydrolase [Streptomyces sp. 769]